MQVEKLRKDAQRNMIFNSLINKKSIQEWEYFIKEMLEFELSARKIETLGYCEG